MTISKQGTFTERGAALTFREDWGPGIGVLEVGTGTVTGTRLALTDRFSAAIGSLDVYTYERR